MRSTTSSRAIAINGLAAVTHVSCRPQISPGHLEPPANPGNSINEQVKKAAYDVAYDREDRMKMLCILAAALLASLTGVPAYAADAVNIGAIYPLTGNAASAGA